MKRILCLVLCLLTALCVTACGGDKTPSSTESSATEAADTPATVDEADNGAVLKAFIARFDDTPTVGDKLIYKDANITVTAHGINYAVAAGPELHLTIDNNFGKDITVQAPYAVVNGYMISPELSMDVASGKSANGNLNLSYFNLALADITCIRNIEFSLRVVEQKSYNPIFKSEILSVPTSAATADEVKPSFDESGQIAYDDNGVKIVLKGVNTDRPFSDGAELMVYMVNDTDRSISVQTDDVTVNGYDMTSVMNRTLLPGKRAVDVVTFYKMDMEEYGIDEIDSVKVSFEIKDDESWETIGATDLISADLKPQA